MAQHLKWVNSVTQMLEKNESYIALTEVSSPDVLTVLYYGNTKRALTKWCLQEEWPRGGGYFCALLYEQYLMEQDI